MTSATPSALDAEFTATVVRSPAPGGWTYVQHARLGMQAFSGAVGCGSRRAGRTTRIPTTPRPHLSQLS
jgi:hypothetical protein